MPETWLRVDESAHEATLRLVREKLGLDLPNIHAKQLATFTEPDRSPGERALLLSYMTFLPVEPLLTPGPEATDAQWFTLKNTNLVYFSLSIASCYFVHC
ncbi:NUDIX hydrolase [Leuconostoc citreum]|uniref:NUDIX hydrolase n=1 Tax=Leuconostoc citreum TaxID=33964 RepID=UPI0032DFACDE